MKKINLYGLQRSGTNYLRYLLQKNYKVEFESKRVAHKHCPYNHPIKNDVIIIVKNPYAWLFSMYKSLKVFKNIEVWAGTHHIPKKHLRGTFSEFLMKDPSVVRIWGEANQHWISEKIDVERSIVIYDDVLSSPMKVTNKIADELNIARKRKVYRRPIYKMAVGRGKDGHVISQTFKEFDNSFYLEHRYLCEYDQQDLSLVNNNLDLDLMNKLNFEVLHECL